MRYICAIHIPRPFNSRPHAEVDFAIVLSSLKMSIFQLTTSRRGRRLCIPEWHQYVPLSTHDLTQRSTNLLSCAGRRSGLSTHDLTQRSTSHHPHAPGPDELSTHDLTQRSTCLALLPCIHDAPFNSRPHAEVDTRKQACTTKKRLSTHDLTQRSTFA